MNRIVRLNPQRDLTALDRFLSGNWAAEAWDRSWLDPAVDMYEKDEQVVVKATLPGIKSEDIDVKIVGNTLTIKGEIAHEDEKQERSYIRRERRYGSFCRVLSIPDVNTDQVTAEFENGVLTLTMPKPESIKPRVIEVKTK